MATRQINLKTNCAVKKGDAKNLSFFYHFSYFSPINFPLTFDIMEPKTSNKHLKIKVTAFEWKVLAELFLSEEKEETVS